MAWCKMITGFVEEFTNQWGRVFCSRSPASYVSGIHLQPRLNITPHSRFDNRLVQPLISLVAMTYSSGINRVGQDVVHFTAVQSDTAGLNMAPMKWAS